MTRREFSKETRRAALARADGRCEATGCNKPIFRRTYCAMHYSRLLRHGDLNTRRRVAGGEGLAWLMAHRNYSGDECLTFPFRNPSLRSDRYGRVVMGGRRMSANHAMCLIVYGDAPTNRHEAAHSCGNGDKGCVNPKHLRWATSAENHADKLIHGTDNRGERHGNAMLSKLDVLAIRDMASRGMSQRIIAHKFKVQQTQISRVVRGVQWGWL